MLTLCISLIGRRLAVGSASTLGPRSPTHVVTPLAKHHKCCDPARAALGESEVGASISRYQTEARPSSARPDASVFSFCSTVSVSLVYSCTRFCSMVQATLYHRLCSRWSHAANVLPAHRRQRSPASCGLHVGQPCTSGRGTTCTCLCCTGARLLWSC